MNKVKHLFIGLWAICISFFGEYLPYSLPIFNINLLVFSLSVPRNVLYLRDIAGNICCKIFFATYISLLGLPKQNITDQVASTTEIYFLMIWRLEGQDRGVGVFDFFWGLLPDLQTAAFSLCPHMTLPVHRNIPGVFLCPNCLFL